MVAIKILKEDLAEDSEIRSRFHDESQAVAKLSHPNIVNVFDVNQSEGVEYIVMELIEGITLKQYMKKRGSSLNWREALHFTSQIFCRRCVTPMAAASFTGTSSPRILWFCGTAA